MSQGPERQELISNAVSFLTDPSVNDTPLTKKIQFLESKGMTNTEIQHALSLAQQQPVSPSNPSSVAPPVPAPQQPAVQYPYYAPPPPPAPHTLDWKDYVIMSTTTVGLLYGAYQVVSRYVLPKVLPPSQSKLDEDREAMEREFQRVEAILEKLENDQTEFIKKQEEKGKAIDETLLEVDAIVKATNEKNLRNEETLKYLKLEIESIKRTLMKSLDSQKDTISSELQELEKKTDSLTQSILSIQTSHVSQQKGFSSSITNTPPSQTPSPLPPSNLLTNNRSTSRVSTPVESSISNLNIPPPSSVPTAKDILRDEFSVSASDNVEKPASDSSPYSTNAHENIPAWQLASNQKANINNDVNASIPSWQLAAQNN